MLRRPGAGPECERSQSRPDRSAALPAVATRAINPLNPAQAPRRVQTRHGAPNLLCTLSESRAAWIYILGENDAVMYSQSGEKQNVFVLYRAAALSTRPVAQLRETEHYCDGANHAEETDHSR